MTHTTLHNQIIHKRLALILQLIKEERDVVRIEREAAWLVLDVIGGLVKKEISLHEGCHCFIQIEYALDQKIRDRFSQEFEDILNEAIILDEATTKHGPDIELLIALATKIVTRKTLQKKTAKDRVGVFTRNRALV